MTTTATSPSLTLTIRPLVSSVSLGFLPAVGDDHLEDSGDVVRTDLSRPMDEIRSQLSALPVRTRVSLTGPLVVARDIAHAKIKERLDAAGLTEEARAVAGSKSARWSLIMSAARRMVVIGVRAPPTIITSGCTESSIEGQVLPFHITCAFLQTRPYPLL